MLSNSINRNYKCKSNYLLNFQIFNNNTLTNNLINKVYIFNFKFKILTINIDNFLIQFYNIFNPFNNNILTLLYNSK